MTTSLLWLVERGAGWGRVYVVEELCGCAAEQRDRIVQRCLAVFDRPEWRDAVRAALGPTSDFFAWFVDHVVARPRPGALSDPTESDER